MKDQLTNFSETFVEKTSEANTSLNDDIVSNPAIQRALRRLKESQVNDNHVSHYTKHSSHAVKHSSSW